MIYDEVFEEVFEHIKILMEGMKLMIENQQTIMLHTEGIQRILEKQQEILLRTSSMHIKGKHYDQYIIDDPAPVNQSLTNKPCTSNPAQSSQI